MCHVSGVRCHVSCVMFHLARVTCHGQVLLSMGTKKEKGGGGDYLKKGLDPNRQKAAD